MAEVDVLNIDEALQAPTASIPYTIHSYSSFSGNFRPSNIIADRPKDSNSRWSCGTVVTNAMAAGSSREGGSGSLHGQPWVMLELRSPAVLSSMTFGKHFESHPCNPQFVTVLAGSDPKHLQQILHERLRNDAQPEGKEVTWRAKMTAVETDRPDLWEANRRISSAGSVPFTVRYVKILPGPAYEARFNPSLWHVDLQGVTSEPIIAKVESRYQQAQSLHANRVVLKYLRSQQIRPAYDALFDHMKASASSKPPLLEHPLLTELHQAIVDEADYDRAEVLIHSIMEDGLMDDHIARMSVTHTWHQLQPSLDADGNAQEPSRRGGHAMCQTDDGEVYLFGGWDGGKNLDDFWVREQADFDMDDEAGGLPSYRWHRLERKSTGEAWPPARSGHAMTANGRRIYMMGAIDHHLHTIVPPLYRPNAQSGTPKPATPPSESFGLVPAELQDVVAGGMPVQDRREPYDLWVYDMDERSWSMLEAEAEDAADKPTAMEVKEMRVIDGTLYVYGVDNIDATKASKLYKFNLTTRQWQQMHSLATSEDDAKGSASPQVAAFDAKTKSLILLEGGPVTSTHSPSLWRIDLATDQRSKLLNLGVRMPLIKAGQPVRAIYDEQHGDMIVVIGHSKSCILPKSGRLPVIGRYSIRLAEWLVMPEATESRFEAGPSASVDFDDQRHDRKDGLEAALLQRCGHQLVHDAGQDACFIIGSSTPATGKRGNDSCMLTFSRPGRSSVKRKCLLALRKQKFIDMVSSAPSMQALHYLQGPLHAVVDHDDPSESRHFRALLAHLLQFGVTSETVVIDPSSGNNANPQHHDQRLGVFDAIMSFVAGRYKQPGKDLLHIAQDTV